MTLKRPVALAEFCWEVSLLLSPIANHQAAASGAKRMSASMATTVVLTLREAR